MPELTNPNSLDHSKKQGCWEQIITHSGHFCTPQPHFRACDLPWPSSGGMTHGYLHEGLLWSTKTVNLSDYLFLLQKLEVLSLQIPLQASGTEWKSQEWTLTSQQCWILTRPLILSASRKSQHTIAEHLAQTTGWKKKISSVRFDFIRGSWRTIQQRFSSSIFCSWSLWADLALSLIHIWRCRRLLRCRSRWSPYH